jgi:hypothetical protein
MALANKMAQVRQDTIAHTVWQQMFATGSTALRLLSIEHCNYD